jgi:DNA polymerase I
MARARLFLIDSYGFIFRAYHARARSGAPPMRTSKGLSTEAVYIFHNMVRKLLNSYKPEYIAAVFESAGPTFREQEFTEYKANRKETPPDLSEQIPWVRHTLEALRIPILEYPGFEADDVIGTLARCMEAKDVEVVIVSSDKDMLQLVDERVSMLNPMKDDTWYDPAKVQEFMGVRPEQVSDLLALKGDAIDNIPGAPGIGDKGARDLILQFGSLESLLDRATEVQRRTYRESLLENRDQILLSKRLATIDTQVPLEFRLESVKAQEPDVEGLRHVYREMEFFSLLRELAPVPTAQAQRAAADYAVLDSAEQVKQYVSSIPTDALTAVAVTARSGDDSLYPAAIGLCWRTGEARAIPRASWSALTDWLQEQSRRKVGHDVKAALLALEERGIEAKGFVRDIMIEAFLLSADPGGCALSTLGERSLDWKLSEEAVQHADCIVQLASLFEPQIEERRLGELYETIELPLIPVLVEMAQTGIRIDEAELRRLSELMDAEVQRLTGEICAAAGKVFNINSPQQLGKVLFEDLKLPAPVKYGKGKIISTAADVLEELAPQYEIVRKVLEYRQVSKLKSTYVDALPALIHPATGRLHTTFNQAGAATGRLSSSNPNLQNIPIRTEQGREIRAAFVPREGWTLIAADYSQIELRLLAHMSQDPVLLEAFRAGEDIHTRTAAEVFGIAAPLVTSDMRRAAKAVNFGIVYGQTSFGLATSLGIPRKEAEQYIRNYFARYAGVRRYLDETIAEVRKSGVARTLLGRQRPIPDIHSRNPAARAFAERTAVNTPLQGTAADLMKVAMIRVHEELKARGYAARMLLQVHDELLCEAPPEEVKPVSAAIRERMEGVYELSVPLSVDVGTGPNWRDAK